jgi:hypothetical protein
MPQQFFVATGTCLPSHCLGTIVGTQTHSLSFYKTQTTVKTAYPTFLPLFCVFAATGMCLPSHCLATMGGG